MEEVGMEVKVEFGSAPAEGRAGQTECIFLLSWVVVAFSLSGGSGRRSMGCLTMTARARPGQEKVVVRKARLRASLLYLVIHRPPARPESLPMT